MAPAARKGSRLVVARPNLRGARALTFDAFGSLLDGGPKDVFALLAHASKASKSALDDGALRDHWIRILDKHTRADPFQTYREVHARAFRELYDRLGIERDVDADVESADASFRRARAYPEVREILEDLEREVPVAVISNTDTHPLLEALHRNGLEFTFVITSEEEQFYKPSVALFRRAARYLGLPPENVLHVGDSYGEDVVGARAAGMTAAFIVRPGGLREPPQDGTPLLRDLGEVRELVRRSWTAS